jgi:hypothetical protein
MVRLRRVDLSRRQAGAVDSRDLLIGIVLALALPFLAVVLVRIFEPREQADPFAKGKTPTFNIPPTQEEVEDRVRYVEDIYVGSAQKYVKYVKDGADPTLKYHMVRWARKALSKAQEKAKEAEEFIQNSQVAAQFAPYIERLATRKKQMEADLQEVERNDVLKRKSE